MLLLPSNSGSFATAAERTPHPTSSCCFIPDVLNLKPGPTRAPASSVASRLWPFQTCVYYVFYIQVSRLAGRVCVPLGVERLLVLLLFEFTRSFRRAWLPKNWRLWLSLRQKQTTDQTKKKNQPSKSLNGFIVYVVETVETEAAGGLLRISPNGFLTALLHSRVINAS